MTIAQIAWLAGYIEGEGTFGLSKQVLKGKEYRYPKIQFATTDEDVARKIGRLWGNAVQGPYMAKLSTKPFWQSCSSGKRAVGLMMTMYPFMGTRRQTKIREVLAYWRK